MKTNHTTRRGFTLVELLVVIVIIAALAGLTAPMVIRQRKKADQTEAISNVKQIGLAMFEFDTEYSSFPDQNTAAQVTAQTGSTLNLAGATANDFFRQLIAANFTQSERMFYAKIANVRKPDDNVFGVNALQPGEVGFAYMMNGVNAFSSSGNPARPLVVTPLLANATGGTFDPDPFDNRAIMLRMDNSATSPNIRQDKTIILSGTSTLLQVGPESVWGTGTTVTPTIVAPGLRGN